MFYFLFLMCFSDIIVGCCKCNSFKKIPSEDEIRRAREEAAAAFKNKIFYPFHVEGEVKPNVCKCKFYDSIFTNVDNCDERFEENYKYIRNIPICSDKDSVRIILPINDDITIINVKNGLSERIIYSKETGVVSIVGEGPCVYFYLKDDLKTVYCYHENIVYKLYGNLNEKCSWYIQGYDYNSDKIDFDNEIDFNNTFAIRRASYDNQDYISIKFYNEKAKI